MKKIYIISFLVFLALACKENALDYESDDNRFISELVKDTVIIKDSVYVIDTLVETIRDTIYVDKHKNFKQVYIDGAIAFSETYWSTSEGDYVTVHETYTENNVKNTFILDQTDSYKILHVNMDFTRNRYTFINRDELVYKVIVNTRYLNMDNVNYLHPFGWNLGLLHYFNVITINKNNKYFSKLDANNIMSIEFENYPQDEKRSKMIINCSVLKHERSPEPNNFISFRLDVPIRIED